jgi:hypothetical protein
VVIGKTGSNFTRKRVIAAFGFGTPVGTKVRMMLPEAYRGMKISFMQGISRDFLRNALVSLAKHEGFLYTVKNISDDPDTYKIKMVFSETLFRRRETFFFNTGISEVTFRASDRGMIYFSKSKLAENKVYTHNDLHWWFKGVNPAEVSRVGRSRGETGPEI